MKGLPGRPEKYDKTEIALKLLEWAQKPDSLNLNGFCGEENIPPTYISRWKHENENFCKAYEVTKALIANRREKGLNAGTVHVKAYDLNAKVYDQFLKEESRDEKKFEASLKSDDQKDQSAERIADAIEKIANKSKEVE